MKTDAQLLQDVMTDLRRTAAGQAEKTRVKAPGMEIRVTLSNSGNCTDADPSKSAGSILVWTSSPAADAVAAPSADRSSSTEPPGTAWARRLPRSAGATPRLVRGPRPWRTAAR